MNRNENFFNFIEEFPAAMRRERRKNLISNWKWVFPLLAGLVLYYLAHHPKIAAIMLGGGGGGAF